MVVLSVLVLGCTTANLRSTSPTPSLGFPAVLSVHGRGNPPVDVEIGEAVVVRLACDGGGEVVSREFRGHDVFYRVRVNGLELVSQRPSNEVVPLGSRVEVTLHDGQVAILS